ncbi:MAG: DNA mismatch repair protein MutS [Proteobacteria bacterium]|nr:MAG: DNA mismatch repair protein MutS [Pseudomonadota bacterium]
MTRRRVVSQPELELWRHATQDVTPLNNMTPPHAAPARRRPRRPSATAQALPSSAAPPATAPFNRAWRKRVARGELEIAAVLDLHGLTEVAAHERLRRFIQARAGGEERIMLVITGKGRGGEGLLRRRLPEWLASSALAGMVAGAFPAHVRHGGAGAFYVVLRRRRAAEAIP